MIPLWGGRDGMDTITARQARIAALKTQVEARLSDLFPPGGSILPAALHHALSTPGKRLRPLLCLLIAMELGRTAEAALDAACAVEMVHAASLVFDDLPCMDDAVERRGQPATHARFGEDVAVLTGVALLNGAYALIVRSSEAPPADRLQMVETLCGAIGLEGLVGGQVLDLRAPQADLPALREAHHRKTGVLFMAAVSLGGALGGASVAEHLALERFAAELGLAFQALDDVCDVRETEPGGDAARSSLISLLGREGAVQEAQHRLAAARGALVSGGARLEPLCAYVDLLMGLDERAIEAAA